MSDPLGMKAVSIHQPYAGLIATGAKTIETRSYPTNHRGPILICSTQRWHPDIKSGHDFGESIRFIQPRDWQLYGEPVGDPELVCFDQSVGTWNCSLPLGHALGVANLVDCLPIVGAGHKLNGSSTSYIVEDYRGRLCRSKCRTLNDGPHDGPLSRPGWSVAFINDQKRRGDFTPGNYGWMLENFQPLDESIPIKGQQQIWTVKESNLR